MSEDALDEIVRLERAQHGVIDVVVAGEVRVEVGADLLVELGAGDPDRVRELLEPLDDSALVDLVQKTVGGSEVPAASVPGRRT